MKRRGFRILSVLLMTTMMLNMGIVPAFAQSEEVHHQDDLKDQNSNFYSEKDQGIEDNTISSKSDLMLKSKIASNDSFQGNTVHVATNWSEVQGIIDNASIDDIIDISALRLSTANITLAISKDIKIMCEPSDKPFYQVYIKNLFFTVRNNATLTLENVGIENTMLDKSMISGIGNAIISKSNLEPSTANGTITVYNPLPTIDVVGDVIVMTTGDIFSSSVAGASIIERNANITGKAGTAIKAVNVSVNGGMVVGGASFESGCNSGDGIIASGNVSVNGSRLNGVSNALVQSGSVGQSTLNTEVGVAIRFSDRLEQRILSVNGGDVFASSRSTSGRAAPYTVKLSTNDIAIIDQSKIGWYTDTPVFHGGFFSITNPVVTWGTTDNATEVFSLTATNATISGTKEVLNNNILTHYGAKDTVISIRANTPPNGKEFKEWVVSDGVSLEDSKKETTTFNMPAKSVEVIATYGYHVHKPSTIWLKDDMNHWHECVDNDGEILDLDSHTFGEWVIDTPATDSAQGSKYRDCKCGQRETGVILKIPTITVGESSVHQIGTGKDLIFTCSGKLEDFIGIYINGELLSENNYTLKSGSTILTLKSSYLDTLSAGKYTLKFQYKDNVTAETTFTITDNEQDSPETGDTTNTMLYLGLFVLAGSVITFNLKKKKIN